jgi:hypothetical protein
MTTNPSSRIRRKRPHVARRSRIVVGTASAVAGVALVGAMYASTSDADTVVNAAASNAVTADDTVSSDAVATTTTTTTTAAATETESSQTSSSAAASASASTRTPNTSSHGS